MATVRFRASIEIRGINPYVLVSAESARVLGAGWRRPMPVLVQINGQPDPPWRINLMPVGDGGFYLYLHADVRRASGTGVGDQVDVMIEFDKTYQNGPMHPAPDWFTDALAKSPEAARNWTALPPSRQKEVLRYLANLKSAEAQARNLARLLPVLAGQDGHFMGRDWTGGA